jgi:hypothetical protein
MKTTAVLTFADPDSTGRRFALRQKKFVPPAPSGFDTWLAAQGVTLTLPTMFQYYDQYRSGCTSTGVLDVTLQVRLEEIDMPYVLRASYGMLDPYGELITEHRREFLAFELVTEKSVDFGIITSATWNGDVYDAEGNIILPPAITFAGTTATAPVPVYGVMEVEVSEEMYQHRLTIAPRYPTLEQAESNEDITHELYASTAMLFCEQRILLLDIEPPENLGTCAGGPGDLIPGGPGDDDDEGTTSYWVTFEIFDYCTGRVISNAMVSVDGGTAMSATGSIQLASGEHTVRVTAPGYTPSHQDDLTENDRFTLGTGG